MSRQFKDTADEMRMISCPAQISVAYVTFGSVSHGRLQMPADNSRHFGPFKAVSESRCYLHIGMDTPPDPF